MTELYAALLGSVLGFLGALVATMVQTGNEEKRSLRTELTHLAAKFLVLGGEIAELNMRIYPERLGGNRKPHDERTEATNQIVTIIERRNGLRDEMQRNLAAFRIGYPQISKSAQKYFDVIDNKDQEHFSVVLVEFLPEAQREFEASMRKVLKVKK